MQFLVAMITGPFYFFRYSVKEGIVALIIPIVIIIALFQLLYDGQSDTAALYYTEFLLWLSIYWVFCVIINVIACFESKTAPDTASAAIRKKNKDTAVNNYYKKFPV